MRSGYAPVNGLKMYYEVHGAGRPLLMLHGGMLTIESSFGDLLPELARDRQVIAAELQGHGRTADIERPPSIAAFGDDIAGLLDHLGLERADLFGFSLGGLTALQTAVRHQERVGHLVLASVHYRQDGYHPEIHEPGSRSPLLPTARDFQGMREAYAAVAPDPDRFEAFAARLGAVVAGMPGWSEDELRAIDRPALLVVGDHDFVRLEHAVDMHHLMPRSRLAVLPGATHIDVMRRTDLLLPMLRTFLP